MGNRRIVLGLLGLILCAVALTAVGADREITYIITEAGDYREIAVTTPLTNVLLSEDGGVIRSVYLTFAPYGSEVGELVPGMRTDPDTLMRQELEGAQFPFTFLGDDGASAAYVLQEPMITEEGDLIAAFVGEYMGATVTKRFTFHSDAIYSIDAEIAFENGADESFPLPILLGSSPASEDLGLHYLFDDEPGTDLLATGSYFSFGGLGLMTKPVVFFLSPTEGTTAAPLVQAAPSGNRQFGVKIEVPAGSSSFRFSLYGGRRRFLLMEDAGLAALDGPGIGARLMIPVIQFLEILYRATGNYGWAIILFTILTRVILFPLMRKQYHSMAKMQTIQPKMKRIQERFKDDKQLQQQKMMELYKKEGVNPMGGCLPLLVQLPILILIWRAILYSAEMIHMSPGFLWISDLSMADPYFVLVIVTTGVMMLQQWLMTPTRAETSGTQKYFGYIFPLVMAFLLWRFPAGLWLYYLLTTGAQVAQQWIVNREMAAAGIGHPTVEDTTIDIEPENADESKTGAGDGGAEGGG